MTDPEPSVRSLIDEAGWIWAHLAEARIGAGELTDGLRAASAARPEFFDSRDLHWRSVRMAELRAVALLRLGRLAEGAALAGMVRAELADRGDSDDLAPPGDLARAAIALATSSSPTEAEVGCAVLGALSSAVDIGEWFSAELADQLRRATAGCISR
jgi:hypothetical protein